MVGFKLLQIALSVLARCYTQEAVSRPADGGIQFTSWMSLEVYMQFRFHSDALEILLIYNGGIVSVTGFVEWWNFRRSEVWVVTKHLETLCPLSNTILVYELSAEYRAVLYHCVFYQGWVNPTEIWSVVESVLKNQEFWDLNTLSYTSLPFQTNACFNLANKIWRWNMGVSRWLIGW